MLVRMKRITRSRDGFTVILPVTGEAVLKFDGREILRVWSPQFLVPVAQGYFTALNPRPGYFTAQMATISDLLDAALDARGCVDPQ